MAKKLELLLTENVEGQGIVGDVVKVSKGFARNYLLPRNFATTPSAEKLSSLAGKRADAQKQMAEMRKQREALIAKLQGYELTMIRSCNDLGILYGAVTQHEIAKALGEAGFKGIKDREVRLGQVIKRVDAYDLHVKFDADLDATIKLNIKPDRELDLRRVRDEQQVPGAEGAAPGAEGAAPGTEGAPKDGAPRDGKPSRDGPRAERGERSFGGDRGDRDEDRRDRRDRERAERLKVAFDKPVHKGFGFGDSKGADAGAAPAAKDAGKKSEPKGEKPAKSDKSEKTEKAKK